MAELVQITNPLDRLISNAGQLILTDNGTNSTLTNTLGDFDIVGVDDKDIKIRNTTGDWFFLMRTNPSISSGMMELVFPSTADYTAIMQFSGTVTTSSIEASALRVSLQNQGGAGNVTNMGVNTSMTEISTFTGMMAQSRAVRGMSSIAGYSDGDFGIQNNDRLIGVYNELFFSTNSQTLGSAIGMITRINGTPTGLTNWVGLILPVNPSNTTLGFSAFFRDDITLPVDKKLYFDSAITVITDRITALTQGDTYLVYDSVGSTLDLFVDATQLAEFATTHLGILGQLELRFYEGANYVGFEAPALSADQIWVLPTADGSANDTLATDGSGTLSWKTTYSEKSWAFSSPTGSSGTFYIGGYYDHSGSSNDFSGGPTFGTANSSYAAHFFVVLGALTVDELTITVTGTSITDGAVRVTSDTENIVIPDATSADAYFETSKKWIGIVTITVASGTAKVCDFGWCKYWDNNNTDFTVSGFEATWFGGADDSSADIQLLHHKATGWTYTGSGATPPAALADMQTDHNTEYKVANNESGAYKRDNLNQAVAGGSSEGTVIQIVTTANKTFELANFIMRIST